MFDREPADQTARLEMLCDEVIGISGIPRPKTDLEVLAFLEAALARGRGRPGWIMRIERTIWRILAPLQDLRIRKQIQLHRGLLETMGGAHPTAKDSMSQLDDFVFARTYGRTVAAPVKKLIRNWVSKDLLSREDAAILIANSCLVCDSRGVVSIKDDRLFWLLGILNFLIACSGSAMLLALLLFSSAPAHWVVTGMAIICLPLGGAWWVFLRYTLHPHRLIPRAKALLPRLQGI